jgi:signal peptidase I
VKKSITDFCREWLDTLVVAISVAMAFRAYFYEPFKIPTGSMQETLWGYHTQAGKEKGAWDTFPVSILKWAVTGEKVVDWDSPASGTIRIRQRNDGFADIKIGTYDKTWKLPTDAARTLEGRYVNAGEKLWKGSITTGDFIFVNRWKWNFFQPKNEDVMIFSTTGIPALPLGTHYIKRMKARPGETYKLEHPIQGRPDTVTMGKDEYFACGDNFNNSFDSRYWGNVPRGNLRGEASFVFWPITGWRIIK